MVNFKVDGQCGHLFQWDVNRKLSVEVECDQVHFANRVTSNALVCTVRMEGDKRLVDVPNILLQTAGVLKVFALVCNGDESYTKVSSVFTVIGRPKPEDYVYTETEVLTYKDLDARVQVLEQGGASADDIAKAIDEYMTENPIEIPKVPEALPNPHKLTLTGAVQAEYDGREAVTVEVPEGGGGSSKGWVEIGTATLAEDVAVWDVDIDSINPDLYGFDCLAVDLHFVAASGNTEEKPIVFKPRVDKANAGERLNINYAIRKGGTYDTSIYIESRGGKGLITQSNTGSCQMSTLGSNDKKITGFNFFNNGVAQLIGAGTTAAFYGRNN